MKTLFIIPGVSGAIGMGLLANLYRKEKVIVYGFSRKALNFRNFLKKDGGLLPQKNFISNIDDITDRSCIQAFVQKINTENIEKIVYIHALGLFPFEVDENGNFLLENDDDADGINDNVMKLNFQSFYYFIKELKNLGKPLKAVVFGSLADKFETRVHSSSWKTMAYLKRFAFDFTKKNDTVDIHVLNISSVICPHEVITRPFVFINTDADPSFWLTPEELTFEVIRITNLPGSGFSESDFFHKADYFFDGYYNHQVFTERKVCELHNL